MARKTVAVDALVRTANGMLAAPDAPRDGRAGIATLVESVLHDTGQYRGFRYLPSELLPDGSALRPGHDDFRRAYYT